jgi:hypothetical protein
MWHGAFASESTTTSLRVSYFASAIHCILMNGPLPTDFCYSRHMLLQLGSTPIVDVMFVFHSGLYITFYKWNGFN